MPTPAPNLPDVGGPQGVPAPTPTGAPGFAPVGVACSPSRAGHALAAACVAVALSASGSLYLTSCTTIPVASAVPVAATDVPSALPLQIPVYGGGVVAASRPHGGGHWTRGGPAEAGGSRACSKRTARCRIRAMDRRFWSPCCNRWGGRWLRPLPLEHVREAGLLLHWER